MTLLLPPRMNVRHKFFLRRLYRGRSVFPGREALRRAELAARRVARLSAYRKAGTVALYLSRPFEIGTDPLVRMCRRDGKGVAVPVVSMEGGGSGGRRRPVLRFALLPGHASSLRRSVHGVLEPRRPVWVPLEEIGLMVVPGAAFTRAGDRLGSGGGHYDRILALRRRPFAAGLAYDEQIAVRLPLSPHDRAVDVVVTPSRLFRAGR